MSQAPLIFDRRLRRLRLDRARQAAPPDFLRRRVADDLAERLAAVPRPFHRALVIGPPWAGADFAAALAGTPAEARIGEITAMSLARPDPPARPRSVATPGARLIADEERLPFAPASFDLIVSSLALHWVNDVIGALIQLRLALKPDGLFLGAFLGGATLTELRQSLIEGEVAAHGGAGPRVSPFIDAPDAAGLLQRAGFALPVADTDTLTVRYGDPWRLLMDLRALGETSVLSDRPPAGLTRATLAEAFRAYANTHADPDRRLRARFEVLTLTGWSPHPDQPKPARRGSGRVSLAEALKRPADTSP